MNFGFYLEKISDWVLASGLKIAVVLILGVIGLKAAKILSSRLVAFIGEGKDQESQKRAGTLGSFIRNILKAIVFIVASMMIMNELGIEIAPILAAAGIVGLAVGFGAQQLVQDVISGFFMLIEDQIRVGDVVQAGGKAGVVEKVNLRMIILRDLSGNVHYIRNGQIDVVTNMTKEYSRYVLDVGVAYREDVDEVIEVLKGIDEELRNDPDFKNDIMEPLEELGLDQFADSAIIIKARIKTAPIQQWRVGREFNRRMKKKFDERNIEIPFPHVTLYMGQDKKGESPPLNVATRGKNNADA